MTTDARPPATRPAKGLDLALWIIQGLLALTFVGGGIWKVVTPIAQVAEVFPWAGEVAPGLLYATAAFDILGGLGVVLPSVTRIRPEVTVAAALGCAALQVAAIVFHVSRGEATDTPFNVVLLALALVVAWGRRSSAPITPRG